MDIKKLLELFSREKHIQLSDEGNNQIPAKKTLENPLDKNEPKTEKTENKEKKPFSPMNSEEFAVRHQGMSFPKK